MMNNKPSMGNTRDSSFERGFAACDESAGAEFAGSAWFGLAGEEWRPFSINSYTPCKLLMSLSIASNGEIPVSDGKEIMNLFSTYILILFEP
jgi:hypothetical protein